MVVKNDEHVVPELRHTLSLDASERILFLEKDNWIGYSRAKDALTKLTNLCNHPKRQRMPNLLLIGPTNNGKSMIIEKFCRAYPPIKKIETNYINYIKKEEKEVLVEMPVLSIQMPTTPDMKQFYSSLTEKVRLAGGISPRLFYVSPLESIFFNSFF
jgi:Bacterial TniB protein